MRVLLAATLALCLLWANACGQSQTRDRELNSSLGRNAKAPPVILWAWQRPTSLTFINPRTAGISYLVETIHLAASGFTVEPNLNGLAVPDGTWLMACARIDSSANPSLVLPPSQVNKLASRLENLAHFPGAKAVQIDFDATVSQRDFYRHLLLELRRRLPASVPISMTALASWCEDDDWISRLPVSEAVPMLFRMGPDRASILARLGAGDDFNEPLCRRSAGISADEVVPQLPDGRRLYIFEPKGWTKASFEQIMARMKQ